MLSFENYVFLSVALHLDGVLEGRYEERQKEA